MSIFPTPHEGPSVGEPAPAFQRKIGLFDATMLVAGTMIGSGIFIVSKDIAADVGSSGWLMAVWVLTGVMTIIGALSYAELAAMMPHAGGQYVFLREAYSPMWGFLYGWACFLVIQTGSIAAVGVAFAKFLGVLVPQLGTDNVIYEVKDLNIAWTLPWMDKPFFERESFKISAGQLVGVAVVLGLSFWNCLGVREGKAVQNVFTLAKTAGLILLIVVGLTVALNPKAVEMNLADPWGGITQTERYQEVLGGPAGQEASATWHVLAVLMVVGGAMVGSLFSADAWNNLTFTAGEVKNPRRTLAVGLTLGTSLVIVLYLLANLAYLAVLPVKGNPAHAAILEAQAKEAEAQGQAFQAQGQRTPKGDPSDPEKAAALFRQTAENRRAEAVFARGIDHARDDRVGTAALESYSPNFAVPFMAVVIMISTFGCVNGMILMGARLYYAMAQDNLFFRSVGRLNARGVPAAGLILQGIWSALLIFSGTYSELLDYVIFTVLIFYALTVVGLFVLRRTQPDADRPYKAFGYPFIPALYALLCAAIAVDLLFVKPVYTWPGLIIVLSGIPVYFLWRLFVRRPAGMTDSQ